NQKDVQVPLDISRIIFETQTHQRLDQPVNTSSEEFSDINYNIISYYKAAEIIKLVESYIGKENFDKGMQEYFSKKKFEHVTPADLQSSLENSSAKKLDSIFNLFTMNGPLHGSGSNGWEIITPFNLKKINND